MFITDDDKNSISKIRKAIEEHGRFLLTTHQVPDGDGIGCELAFLRILRGLNKKVFIINEMKASKVYSFLSGFSEIQTFDLCRNKKINPDVVIAFDCSNKDRIGKPLSLVSEDCLIINIDHHQKNTYFGEINWVCENSSSVGEMCFIIADYLCRIEKKVAECLYVSILTDTGSFRYNFDRRTIAVIDKLLEIGIDPEKIANNIYCNNSIASLKLVGHALVSMQVDPDVPVAWTVVTEQMFKETKAEEQDTEIVINMLQSVGKMDFVFLVRERKNEIKFSLRSRNNFNVRKLAEHFGGGGHNNAAGFSIKGMTVESAMEVFFRYLKQQKR